MGFAVAVGIAIDATLIRLVLLPALMRVFGDWNRWLPAWLDRILPKVGASKRVELPPDVEPFTG